MRGKKLLAEYGLVATEETVCRKTWCCQGGRLIVEKVAVDKVDILEIAEKVVIEKQASQTAKSFVSLKLVQINYVSDWLYLDKYMGKLLKCHS